MTTGGCQDGKLCFSLGAGELSCPSSSTIGGCHEFDEFGNRDALEGVACGELSLTMETREHTGASSSDAPPRVAAHDGCQERDCNGTCGTPDTSCCGWGDVSRVLPLRVGGGSVAPAPPAHIKCRSLLRFRTSHTFGMCDATRCSVTSGRATLRTSLLVTLGDGSTSRKVILGEVSVSL